MSCAEAKAEQVVQADLLACFEEGERSHSQVCLNGGVHNSTSEVYCQVELKLERNLAAPMGVFKTTFRRNH